MRTLSSADFLRWAADRGIGPHPQYPNSSHLIFRDASRASRYWEYPKEPSNAPHFLDVLVSAVGKDQRYWLYPGRGYWSLGHDAESWPSSRTWKASIHGLNVPRDLVGAVGIESDERDVLLAMLFLQITLAPAVLIDTLVVPESGDAVLFFEHHDVVHVSFREERRLLAAVRLLADAGYPLPTEPPDETFKPVSWMTGETEEGGDGDS